MKSQGEIESDKMEQERGLFYEIDKGIDAMKKGHIMQHDEAMQIIINRIDQAIFESEILQMLMRRPALCRRICHHNLLFWK